MMPGTTMHSGAIQSGALDFDINAREAQVVGTQPRVAPLTAQELTEAVKDLSALIRSVFGVHDNSVIPDLFATMARTPGLYRCQLEMGVQLVRHGTLPARERELAILRIGWLCRAPFEWGEHVEFAKSNGVSAVEIERITRGSADPAWGEHDRNILRAVEELVGDHAISDDTWEALASRWNEQQLMELPVLAGHYILTALLHNSLRIQLLPANVGLRHR
jgi:4-carboxymuconolactone decarboxylase